MTANYLVKNFYAPSWAPFGVVAAVNAEMLASHHIYFDCMFHSGGDSFMKTAKAPANIEPADFKPLERYYVFKSNEHLIGFIAEMICGVQPKMRLRCGNQMCDELQFFFHLVYSHICNAKTRKRFILDEVAGGLNKIGVMSATGLKLSGSHVSNAIRKSLLNVGAAYEKPGYKGRNFLSFSHERQPFKVLFDQ